MEVEVGSYCCLQPDSLLNSPIFSLKLVMGNMPELFPDLQFERLASASGPTLGGSGDLLHGRYLKKIVFAACADSRDSRKRYSLLF